MIQFLIYAGAFILVLVSVITVHEFGHFAVGKLSGIKVEEFAIGFGPKLYSRTVGETLYAIRAIPAGGFVRMAGMLGLTGESDAGDRNFYRASRPKRFATVSAGIIVNFIFGGLIFAIVDMQPTPYAYAQHAAAGAAGLTSGDTILAIDGHVIRQDSLAHVTTDLHNATTASQGHPLTVVFRASDGSVHTTTLTPTLTISNILDNQSTIAGGKLPVGGLAVTSINGAAVQPGDPAQLLGGGAPVTISGYLENEDGSAAKHFTNVTVSGITDGYATNNAIRAGWIMGVVPGFDGESPPAAIATGFSAIPGFVWGEVTGIYGLIVHPPQGGVNGPQGFTGPVGIAQETAVATNNGFLGPNGLLWWIGFISLNLGFVNMLPIPFLDGGKLLFILIESVRRRRLNPKVEAAITAVGLAVVVVFAVYVTIGDVSRL
ncbi:MAG: site-2 protease family protein [Candidatus Dormiibacterota bacterium]